MKWEQNLFLDGKYLGNNILSFLLVVWVPKYQD